MSLLGRRCTSCGLTWPAVYKYYQNCPECGRKTDVISFALTEDIMSETEAASRLNKVNFARFERGDKLLPAPSAPPSAKELVERDAQRRERLSKFDSVIRGAGFTIQELEAMELVHSAIARLGPSTPNYDDDMPYSD
jgi:predicted  nucleic acid-binding Zn-ribbon protein